MFGWLEDIGDKLVTGFWVLLAGVGAWEIWKGQGLGKMFNGTNPGANGGRTVEERVKGGISSLFDSSGGRETARPPARYRAADLPSNPNISLDGSHDGAPVRAPAVPRRIASAEIE